MHHSLNPAKLANQGVEIVNGEVEGERHGEIEQREMLRGDETMQEDRHFVLISLKNPFDPA